MIRITINNEEVVCKNNIKINEKMLSTSSVVLNNCYPKSWEEDKDYVSRFYFPKDYSKCIIEDGASVITILGSTKQHGNPTLNNPIPIENKTGTIVEHINGFDYVFNLGNIQLCQWKNDVSYRDYIAKSTGINIYNKDTSTTNEAIDNDGSIISQNDYTASDYIPVNENNEYWMSFYYEIGNSNTSVRVAYYNENKEFINIYDKTTQQKFNFTTPSNTAYIRISFLTDVYKTIQIEQNSMVTPYQPYGINWYALKWNSQYIIDPDDITIDTTFNNVDYAVIPKRNDYMGHNEGFGFEVLCTNANWIDSSHSMNSTQNINHIRTYQNDYNNWYIGFTKGTSLATMKSTLENAIIQYPRSYVDVTIIDETYPTLLDQLKRFDGKLIFCGVIKNTGKISLNPRDPHYVDLQVLDFKTMLSEGETLSFVINNKTITEAIMQVIENISDYGFVLGRINIQNADDIISAYSTLNKTAYDVFQYIADITQSRWTTRVINENTIAIDFIDPTIEEKQTPIEYTENYFCDNKIVDMSFNYSTNDYRNKQIMTSDEVFGNIIQTETKVADGYATTFMCDNKIGQITSITTNGVSSTYATKNEVELGATADYVYQPGETTFNSSNNLTAGDVIVISYYPIVKGREIVINNDEITRISTQIGRKGVISRYENRNDTTSSQELIKIGQSYIKYKGSAEISLKIVSELDLFEKCDIVDFDAPLDELTTEYMVKDKIIDIYPTANKVLYTFELSSNFNSEDAINYFDNQRAKNQGNIGEGETITRNIDIENTAIILFYDTDIQEVEVSNNTTLDFSLDGVLI